MGKASHEILKLLRLSFIIKSDTGDLVADIRFPIPGSPESYKSIILILLRKLISVVEHHVHGSGMSRIGHNRWLTLPGKLLPSHSLRFRREVRSEERRVGQERGAGWARVVARSERLSGGTA